MLKIARHVTFTPQFTLVGGDCTMSTFNFSPPLYHTFTFYPPPFSVETSAGGGPNYHGGAIVRWGAKVKFSLPMVLLLPLKTNSASVLPLANFKTREHAGQ